MEPANIDALDARLAEIIRAFEGRLAEKDAIIAALQAEQIALKATIANLEKVVHDLTLRLGQNSRNSHKPPSSDPPGSRPGSNRKSGKKRGGQAGHKGRHRELLPEDKVTSIEDLYPDACEDCLAPLPKTADATPVRSQHVELPEPKPIVTEYRRHAVACKCCGHVTRASGDGIIPRSPFGPRLMAMVALFTGVYHLSRRRAVEAMKDVLGIDISLGAASGIEARVSDALGPAYEDLSVMADEAAARNADATTWLESGKRRCIWVIATVAVTVFKIVADGTAELLEPLFASKTGILISDRATVFSFWKMDARQICWAHLVRKFVSFTERGGKSRTVGQELLDYAALTFTYWRDFKARVIDHDQFTAFMKPVREAFEDALERAAAAGLEHVSGSCQDMLAHRQALWNFVANPDVVGPTNNHAERELRAFVLWRKRCFGSQSERGNLFAERVMSVAHSARKQQRHVLAFLTACCSALLDGTAPPSLLRADSI